MEKLRSVIFSAALSSYIASSHVSLSTVASWVSSKSPYGNGSLPYAPYTPAWKEWFNEVNGGRFHMIVKEDAGNLIRAVSLDG